MASYTKPDDRLSEDQLTAIIAAAIPSYAYHDSPREWIWTNPGGVWYISPWSSLWTTAVRACERGSQMAVRTSSPR